MVANSLVRFTSLPHRAIFRILEMRVYEEWALVAGPLGVKCKEHTFSTGGKKASGCFFRKRPLRALHLLPARLGVLLCRGGAGKWDATKRTAAICNTHRHHHLPPSPAPRASRTQRRRRGSCTSPRLCRRGSRLPGSSFRMGFGRTGGKHTRSPATLGGAGRRLRVRPEGVWVQGGSRAAPPRGRSPGHSILARARLPQLLPSGKVPAWSWPPEAPAPTQARSTPHSSPKEKRPGRRGQPGRQHGGGAPALGCRRAASLLGDSRGRLEPGAGDRCPGALRPQW